MDLLNPAGTLLEGRHCECCMGEIDRRDEVRIDIDSTGDDGLSQAVRILHSQCFDSMQEACEAVKEQAAKVASINAYMDSANIAYFVGSRSAANAIMQRRRGLRHV